MKINFHLILKQLLNAQLLIQNINYLNTHLLNLYGKLPIYLKVLHKFQNNILPILIIFILFKLHHLNFFHR